MWNLLALMWNLDPKPSMCNLYAEITEIFEKLVSGTFVTNLFAKGLCGTFMWNFGNLNHSVEPFSGTFELLFVGPGNL